MTDLTPADLAKFVHRVPVGATIPLGMEFCYQKSAGPIVGPLRRTIDGAGVPATDATPYWTAEPIPEPTLAQRARALIPHDLYGWPDLAITSLAILVAELAEKVEAQP